MTVLVTSDTHLTDRPADEYRWRLFKWLEQQKADELIICGDLVDQKDRHGARLVNRLCNAIMELELRMRIFLLKGNHDYLDPNHPFFQFLGNSEGVAFITNPVAMDLSIGKAFFMPAGAKWNFDLPNVDYLFAHATFSGAKAETGHTLTGVDPAVVDGFAGQILSGDVHVPQKLRKGQIEYIGAPYHIRFGDVFEPRILLIKNSGRMEDLYFPAPRKHTFRITKPDDLLDEEAAAGDHVKVLCLLRRAEYVKWRDYRREIQMIAAEREWLLFGAEPVSIGEEFEERLRKDDGKIALPEELVSIYVKQRKASDEHLTVGKQLLLEGDKE